MEKKHWKARALAVFTCLALCVGLLAACSQNQTPAGGATGSTASDEAAPAAEGGGGELLEFSMMYNDNPSYPFNNDWQALQLLQEVANVKMDIQAIPSQDYDSKVRVVLNSGNMPDYITFLRNDVYTEFIDSGLLLNISEHMDKFPNLKEKIEAYNISQELDNWCNKDGDLYGLPFMNEKDMYNTCPAIRQDVLDKYGLDVPTDFDELYQVLKTVKENEPDSLPMANHSGEISLRSLSGASWGIEGSYNGFMFDEGAGEFYYANTGENYKAYLTFLNRLMTEGLADPELYTASLDQWKQKMVSGTSIFCYTWVSELAQINVDGKQTVGEEFNLVPIAPIEGPGGKLHRAAGRIYQIGVIPASAADKPYFDELCAFIDWMSYSDEGSVYTTWGIEGVTYEDKDGERQFTPEVLEADSVQYALWQYGAANSNFTQVYPYDWFIRVLDEPLVESFTQVGEQEGWFPPVAKTPKITLDERETEKMLLTSVTDYCDQMRERFVFGKADLETEWDEYVATIEEKGAAELLELYNGTL